MADQNYHISRLRESEPVTNKVILVEKGFKSRAGKPETLVKQKQIRTHETRHDSALTGRGVCLIDLGEGQNQRDTGDRHQSVR